MDGCINDIITKNLLHLKNKSEYGIITTSIDCDGLSNENAVYKYLNDLISNNDILKKNLVYKNNNLLLKNIDINIDKHLIIDYCNFKKFDSKIKSILNKKLKTNWFFHFFIDKINKKTKMVFSISHAYADGYKIISLLTNNPKMKIPIKKRKPPNFLLLLINTIIVFFIFIKNTLSIIFKRKSKDHSDIHNISPMDYIKYSLPFDVLKEKASNLNITLNDLLYCLCIKIHYHYYGCSKNILIGSPIYTFTNYQTNNFFPLCNYIDNSLPINKLKNVVHNTLNYYKQSLYIPMVNLINKYLNFQISSKFYNLYFNSTDIIFTNIIGPNKDEISENKNITNLNLTVKDISFYFNNLNKELVCCFISYENNINFTLCFKKNLYDKKLLKKSFKNAYKEVINL